MWCKWKIGFQKESFINESKASSVEEECFQVVSPGPGSN